MNFSNKKQDIIFFSPYNITQNYLQILALHANLVAQNFNKYNVYFVYSFVNHPTYMKPTIEKVLESLEHTKVKLINIDKKIPLKITRKGPHFLKKIILVLFFRKYFKGIKPRLIIARSSNVSFFKLLFPKCHIRYFLESMGEFRLKLMKQFCVNYAYTLQEATNIGSTFLETNVKEICQGLNKRNIDYMNIMENIRGKITNKNIEKTIQKLKQDYKKVILFVFDGHESRYTDFFSFHKYNRNSVHNFHCIIQKLPKNSHYSLFSPF